MRYAHLAAITAAREAGAILSFDPNLRFPLWPDREQLRQTVWQFLPLTHILKLSDEELPFLTGTEDIEAALPRLFTGDVQLVLYTCGSKGARAYTRTASAHARSPKVAAVDTTGAGDGFIGSFLWQLQRDGVTAAELPKLSRKRLTEYLIFPTASVLSACSTTAPSTATPPWNRWSSRRPIFPRSKGKFTAHSVFLIFICYIV